VGVSTKGRIRRHLPAGRPRPVAAALALTGLLAATGAAGPAPAWAQTTDSTTSTSSTTTVVLPSTTVVVPSTPTGLPPITALPTSTTVPTGGSPPASGPPASGPPTTPPTTTIRSQQDHVVTAAHMIPLYAAGRAVDQFTTAIDRDIKAITADQAARTAAAAALTTATARLIADQSALAFDRTVLAAAHQALALDRARLGALAIAMYTGALTNPQPASPEDLPADQEQIIVNEEADIVAGQVDTHLHLDEADVGRDRKRTDQVSHTVDTDQQARSRAAQTVTDVAHRTTTDQAMLVSDHKQLAVADRALDTAEASLATALVAVHGPAAAPPGQLSLLGAAALDAAQLVSWYNSQGYVDLTSASIQDLANWYIHAGAEEGVRGDVAFAQAVLETGGFASPDAVALSNFAGIGHCDTCASGWAFPSPQLGVLGHIQLLRIFADKGPGPAHAPPPVLPVLVPADQGEAGCCSTVESLTGVWATDPTYGQQILEIYASMLASALSPA
jgi:flagellum-specific peptidoglycan hydrolase FlgJ